mmetsp:Transcript_18911/g.40537  ORF Transcript_18911/g.40537 Transcript_18911/m.40537 type:complete len:206 (+) Transcript_18911:490-1107(+)
MVGEKVVALKRRLLIKAKRRKLVKRKRPPSQRLRPHRRSNQPPNKSKKPNAKRLFKRNSRRKTPNARRKSSAKNKYMKKIPRRAPAADRWKWRRCKRYTCIRGDWTSRRLRPTGIVCTGPWGCNVPDWVWTLWMLMARIVTSKFVKFALTSSWDRTVRSTNPSPSAVRGMPSRATMAATTLRRSKNTSKMCGRLLRGEGSWNCVR